MAASFFFYDLETSGINPRSARVMQFAGQRTDLDLKPLGQPTNVLIKMTPDILPEPDAIFITGITPQQSLAEGVTEAEFLKIFYNDVVKPETIFVGFNNIRFDDEFMRFLNYRNFYDAYEWEWANGRSRWDLLDIVRITRALRPDEIEWPYAPNGKPTNRLEFLTKVNKLDHISAHDALSDVQATIAVAKLIRTKHQDLFDYLLGMRDKKKIAQLVQSKLPFVYTSGHYPSSVLHTSVAVLLTEHPQAGAALVYDLRHDPTPFLKMTTDQLEQAWKFTRDPDVLRLPVKTLKYNRCPVIAPLGVMKEDISQKRIDLPLGTISKHLNLLKQHQAEFADKVLAVVDRLDTEQAKSQASLIDNPLTVDARLYEGFVSSTDKQTMRRIQTAEPESLAEFSGTFHDERLKSLLPLYKARNFPGSLDSQERETWDSFCQSQLYDGGQNSRLAKYFARLQELAAGPLTKQQEYILEELQLYGQSIVPAELS